MIINKVRLQEEHPMARGPLSWPLPNCDLHLDYTAGLNGYLIKAAEGFGPPTLAAVVEGFDNAGIPIMGSDATNRQMAFRIELKPGLGQSYSSLRDDLYKFMSRSVLISLMNGSITLATVTGFIRQFDTVHFSNQPEVQISIECEDGDLVSAKLVPIPFAQLNTLQPVINYQDGTAPTGLNLKFNVIAPQASFSFTNHAKLWYMGDVPVNNQFKVTYPFVAGDVVTLDTNAKEKKILLLRGGVTTDLAGYVNPGAIWPRVYSGVNVFDWTFSASWMTWVSASYTPRYWGV